MLNINKSPDMRTNAYELIFLYSYSRDREHYEQDVRGGINRCCRAHPPVRSYEGKSRISGGYQLEYRNYWKISAQCNSMESLRPTVSGKQSVKSVGTKPLFIRTMNLSKFLISQWVKKTKIRPNSGKFRNWEISTERNSRKSLMLTVSRKESFKTLGNKSFFIRTMEVPKFPSLVAQEVTNSHHAVIHTPAPLSLCTPVCASDEAAA
ncbi:hypothetical protein WA026_009287 [Henosepilachna vigintioctopunctata]|uniref:Uncharacterized protein n=1 Tax=Henosepilachna vigintioctopunctata TaxID=420089 RepID=A0AAW1UPE9_9CUCU